MHVNQIFQPRPSRAQRRSKADRAQRTHSFSRSWHRGGALHVAVMASLLPISLLHSAHAQTSNVYTDLTGDGNYSDPANWLSGTTPDGSNGIYYAVTDSLPDTLTHSGSTGPGGVDTIYSMNIGDGATFSLSGGVLAGSQSAMASTFTNNGSFNVNGGTLRNFTVSGNAVSFSGNGNNLLDTDTFNGATLDLTNGGFAGFANSLTLTGNAVANIASNGDLVATNNSTLSGTVNFTDGNGSNILGTDNGDTLTLASGSLVHGITGQIGVAQITAGNGVIVNHGTISSDGGGTVTLNAAGGTTSDGTLQAKNNSTLVLSSNLNSTGGTLNIQDTSAIEDNGVSVTGGTVTGSGHMTFTGSGANLLTGVTFSGATLDLTNGGFAGFASTLSLEGNSVANIAGNGELVAVNNSTLSGTVDFTDGNGNNVLGTDNGDTLTLASGSLVHGNAGQIGVAELVGGNGVIVNHGTISSDGGGTIVLNPGGGTNNSGTLQAKNNSTLRLDDNVTNTANGTLNIQDTSAIEDNGVGISGGTVTGSGHMTFTGSQANLLTGVTFNEATLDLTNGGFAGFANSLTLTGNSVANIASNGELVATNNSTLSGTVDFADGNGNNELATDNADTLTLASGSLVHGITGQIGVAQITSGNGVIVNHGTISSDGGGTIYLNPGGGTTNTGTLQAKNNSTLRLDDNVTNTGNGTLNIQDTSAIEDNGVSVTGGTVTGSGHMTFTGSGANLLTGVTFNEATLDLTNGGFAGFANSLTLTNGSVANIASNGELVATNNSTLSGTVDFTDGNGSNILGTDNGDTLTLASGSLVHGNTGQIGVAELVAGAGTVINHGTISSDGGSIITLNPGNGTTNDGGLLQAKESGMTGSTLVLDSNVTNINGGTLNIQDTSAIQNNGVSVTGGTVTGSGHMTFTGGGNDFLTGVTFSGATLDLTNGNDARFTNGLTLDNGSVANIGSNGTLSAAASTTLSGTVDFTDGNGSNELATEGGDTLTLASGSLVHGITGQVGVAAFTSGPGVIVNDGTISSDGGGTIYLNPGGGTTNDGTLQAKNGSTLRLDDNVTNTANGTLNIQDTSAIQNNGVDITGGTVTGSGHMTFSGGGNDFLTGVTFSGATLDLTNGNDARFTNGLTLDNGSVANIGSNGTLSAAASTTLSGTVDFTDGNGSNELATENGDTLTLASGSLVHGITGQVGVAAFIAGSGTVDNNGTILSDGGGNITINPGTLNNGTTGTIQANGGTVTISPVLNNAGTVLVNAGNTMTANSGETQTGGVTQVDGTFTSNNAPVTINGGTLKGTGTIQGNVADAGGTVSPGDGTGTLTVTGNYTQDSTSALDIGYTAGMTTPSFTPSNGLLDVTGAVTLGGTLDVAFLGPSAPGVGYLAVAGEPGTGPFDFLNFGTLTNTDFGTLFSNEYMVGSNYFVNGIAADDFGGVAPVYQLSEVNGDQLDLKLTTVATPEPSQWAAFGFGFLGLGGLALRARRRAAASA